MSVVQIGPQTKRLRSDDDREYAVIPPKPRQTPLMHIDDLYNKRGFEDAVLTLKRPVSGTMHGEERVKIKITGYQNASSNWVKVRAEGVVLASTLETYPAGMLVKLSLNDDGTSEMSSVQSDAYESFKRVKFKGKKDRHVSSTRERDAYLAGHSEHVVVVRLTDNNTR
jgi:hypothetical protein